MFIKYILILVLIFAFGTSAQTWQNYTTDNSPLPSNTVTSIKVNEDGTLWFGTDKGLASYKNETWKTYTTNDGLSSDVINSLSFIPDNGNELWVSTLNGTTKFLSDSTEISSTPEYLNTTNSDLLSDTVFVVETDVYVNNWFGTMGGISVLTSNGMMNIKVSSTLSENKINDLNSRSNEWMHAATNGKGVSRFKYNGVDGITSASVIIAKWSFLASDTVLAIHVTDDTLRWYGTANGVSTHFGDKTKDVPVSQGGSWWIYNTITSGIINNYCRAITSDGDGNMWFGTKGGLSKYNTIDSIWTNFTVDDGLISNNIFDVEIDNDNSIWIATNNGLSKLTNITSINEESEIIPNSYEFKLDAYPNPFNPTVNFSFSVNNSSKIKIEIYNINGEIVKYLDNKYFSKGIHTLQWNGVDNYNRQVNTGVYLVRAISSHQAISKKIMLLK